MKTILTVLLVVSFNLSIAQLKKYSIAAEGGGAIVLNTYTKDSMIAYKRQGKIGVGEDSYINAYFLFYLRNPNVMYKVGVGYSERNFSFSKYTLGDFFASLFVWDAPYRGDSFYLKKVKILNQYINFPLGISYRLSKGRQHVCEAFAGIQLNPAFLMASHANTNFDSAYLIPSPAEKNAVEKKYAETSGKFLASLYPRLDLKFNVYKGWGLDMTLFPFLFYLNSSNKKLISGSFGFSGFLGAHYDF